jgi:hypothetical protein
MKLKNIDFKSIRIIIILVLFVLGLLYVTTYKHIHLVETFELNNKCPNLLVKKGTELHLVNTKKAIIPGVNPIKFKNLEEYAEFIKYQKYMKINCPILYYEETYDTQNNKGYRLLNSPFDKKTGMPSNFSNNYNIHNRKTVKIKDATLDKPPYNKNQYHGFDEQNQRIGLKTKIDDIKLEEINPMETHWKGDAATRKSIENGDFVGRTRNMNNPFLEEKILKEHNEKCR